MSDSDSSFESEDESDTCDPTDTDDTTDNDNTIGRPNRLRKLPNEFIPKTGWTLTEKQQLFIALAEFGSTDIKILSEHIPTRSEEEVKDFVNTYERLSRCKCVKDTNFSKAERVAPVDKWLTYILKCMADNSHKMMLVSRALKYIALFEPRIPSPDVKLQNCYEVLEACMSGEAPKYLNREGSAFIFSNVQKLARNIRFNNHTQEENFLNGPKKLPKVKCYSSKKKNTSNQESIHLIQKDEIINPLSIPENLSYM